MKRNEELFHFQLEFKENIREQVFQHNIENVTKILICVTCLNTYLYFVKLETKTESQSFRLGDSGSMILGSLSLFVQCRRNNLILSELTLKTLTLKIKGVQTTNLQFYIFAQYIFRNLTNFIVKYIYRITSVSLFLAL